MTIPNKIIELAVDGGYQLMVSGSGVNYGNMILDPLFWKSLGKQLGWLRYTRNDGDSASNPSIEDMPNQGWKESHLHHAHQLFNLLLTGGDTDVFWRDLLDKK